MNRQEIIGTLRGQIRALGFEGRGRQFRVLAHEVAWFVALEMIPRTTRVGVSVGICPQQLASSGWPVRADECPIVLDPTSGTEALLGQDTTEVWRALDEESSMSDIERGSVLKRLTENIVAASRRLNELAALRVAMSEGKLGGAVRRDARELLTAGALD